MTKIRMTKQENPHSKVGIFDSAERRIYHPQFGLGTPALAVVGFSVDRGVQYTTAVAFIQPRL